MKTFLSKPLARKLSRGTKLTQILLIPLLLSIVLSTGYIESLSSGLHAAGLCLFFISAAIYSLVLLSMIPASDHFKWAAIFVAPCLFVFLIAQLIHRFDPASEWTVLLGYFLISILTSCFCYQEFQGFEEVTLQTETALSERWSSLWQKCLILCIAFVASRLLTMTSLHIGNILLGNILALVCGLLMLVLQGFKWVLLKDTSKSYANWTPDPDSEKITSEFEIKDIRFIEYTDFGTCRVHTRSGKAMDLSALSFREFCEYLKNRGITELMPVSGKTIVNARYIKEVGPEQNGSRTLKLSGEKEEFQAVRPYSGTFSGWNHWKK